MSVYWLQNADRGTVGPVALHAVRELARAGILRADVLVSKDQGPFIPIRTIPELSHLADHLAPGPPPTSLGDLSKESCFSVFRGLYERRQTGLLTVRDGTRLQEVYLEDGDPVFVGSNSLKERLGDFLVSRGAMSKEDLERALQHTKRHGARLRDTLVSLDIVSETTMQTHLREQQLIRLVDLCTWDGGRYAYYEGRRYVGEKRSLHISTAELVLRAARRAPERTILARLGQHLHTTPRVTTTRLLEEALALATADEARAAYRVDGFRSLVHVITKSGEDRRHVLTVVYLMWELGALSF